MLKKEKLSPINLIVIIMLSLTLVKLLEIIVTDGAALRNYIWEFDTSFRDYLYHVKTSMMDGNVYDRGNGSCFPPLAYLFYKILAAFCKVDNSSSDLTGLTSSTSYLLSLILVEGLTIVLMAITVKDILDREKVDPAASNMIAFLLVSSNVVLSSITSGNIAFSVSVILLMAMALRDSKNGILREISLILIAIAACFKIYPCVMGAHYLREKRYKEAVRLIIYGILLFFLPFVFFEGIYGFKMFLKNITEVGGIVTDITIIGLVSRILSYFMASDLALIIARIVDIIYFIIILTLVLTDKRKNSWKTILFVSSMMIVVNTESGSYCLSYMIMPFVFFVVSMAQKKKYLSIDYLYAVLFALFYTMIPIPILGGASFIPTIIMYLILLTALTEELITVIKSRKLSREDSIKEI
ncbi:MAG: glycosyltransferase 87 family protein [Lachnospiraceae bacterium]|nr:glycosyltransferase 87 family protein [Lachnospiraceae bacterium]